MCRNELEQQGVEGLGRVVPDHICIFCDCVLKCDYSPVHTGTGDSVASVTSVPLVQAYILEPVSEILLRVILNNICSVSRTKSCGGSSCTESTVFNNCCHYIIFIIIKH